MSATEISFMENLREAVRGNPLAAALIGGGALWLLLGNERLKNAASSVSAATAPLAKATSPTSGAAAGAADAIKDRFDEGVAYARDSFSKVSEALPRQETVTKVQSSLSNLLERQPLVLGALGLAVGAVVAGAFRRSDLENEWAGELSDSVKEDLNARAGAVSESVREASDSLKAEVNDVGSEALERLRQTGRNAMDAVRGKGKA